MFVLNLILSATLISLGTWLADRFPVSAGFVVGAIPLSTAITLALTHSQYGDSEKTYLLARSVMVGMILSVTFFIPFLIAPRFKINFWWAYGAAIVIVCLMYPLHQKVMASFK